MSGRHSEKGVRNCLHRLVGQGIVNARRAGKADLYSLNRRHLAAPYIIALAGLRHELLARIRAALRTAEQPSASEIVVRDLRLDLLSKVAWRAGQRIDLAPREWALLELFMRHPNQVLSRAQILSHVWDYSFDTGSNVVDVYVGYLRRKLNKDGLPPMLVTVRGAGYRLVDG